MSATIGGAPIPTFPPSSPFPPPPAPAQKSDAPPLFPAADGKKVIFHPKMLPAVAVADPELTRGLPPHLTAATGFDALAHALEALCAPTYHPPCEGIALEALRLVRDNLPRAFADGGDIPARANMMTAAMMGAVAFQKGLGAVHSLSHPLGFLFKIHHGLLNAVLLPFVIARNCEADKSGATARKLARLARFLRLTPADPEGVLRWLLDLRRDLQIPHSLAAVLEWKDDPAMREKIAQMAAKDPTAATNPIALDPPECARILDSALAGKI